MRLATKNSANDINKTMSPTVQKFIAPNERAISSIIGAKASTAAYK